LIRELHVDDFIKIGTTEPDPAGLPADRTSRTAADGARAALNDERS
jgi:hypothetical protein